MERLLDSLKVEAQRGNVRLDCNWCCERQIPRRHTSVVIGLVLTMQLAAAGCSVRKFAINKLGDSLAHSGSTFAADNDPEFVGQAIPFSLKLIEGLLAESPKHRGLLFAAASGFTQYSYVYVQQPSEELDTEEAEVVNSLGFQAVPLEWSDVLISLQTGLVDTVPVTPFYALASQYDLAAKNLLEVKYVPLVGATVMTKRAWDVLTVDQLEKVLKAAGEAARKIRDQSRAENQQAIDAMKKRGLQVHSVSPELEEEWRHFAESVYPKMRGKMIPADVFDKTLSLVVEYRAAQKTGQP